MDGFDHAHGQNLTIGLTRKLIGTVRRTHGNRQGIDTGLGNEIDRLIRIGQQLIMAERAFETVALFFFALTGFKRAQNPQLSFDRDTTGMGHFDDAARHIDIIVIAGRGLGIGHQRAIHHHRGKAVLNRRGAGP